MKKKLLIVLLALMLCGCEAYSDETTINHDGIDEVFENIEDERFLFYDKNTKIIYYLTNSWRDNGGCYSMPYISENGHFCKYVDGKIVEVQDE